MMRNAVFVVVVCLIACVVAESEDNKHQVNVDVYYESLCPDSIRFVTKQLYPSLEGNLAKYINLTLIPYGKSNTTKDGEDFKFSCHHGPGECRGNKIHACALKIIEDGKNSADLSYNKVTLGFINCLLGTVKHEADKTVFPTQECAKNYKVEHLDKIEKCATEKEGNEYLNELGVLTEALQSPLKSVPTIVFNKEFKVEDSQLAQENFVKALCQYIKEKPAECNTPEKKE